MGSWEVFGIKTPRSNYVQEPSCAVGEMLDCDGACRSMLTLGDGVCDAGFYCQALVRPRAAHTRTHRDRGRGRDRQTDRQSTRCIGIPYHFEC